MKRRIAFLAFAVLVAGLNPLAQALQSGLRFRAGTDLISINVSVRISNRPVDGLTAADFAVLDNQVPQIVRAVDMTAVPVDLTFVVGVNGSTSQNLARYHSDLISMAEFLRPDDHLRVIEFGSRVAEVFPLQAKGTDPVSPRLERAFRTTVVHDAVGWAAFHDALVAAMILPVTSDRRQLVMAFAGGNDSLSVLSKTDVLEVAQRTEAVLHILLFESTWGSIRNTPIQRQMFGTFPYLLTGEQDLLYFRDVSIKVANTTGGEAYQPSDLPRSIVDAFREILDDYRRSYLLQYELTGVPREGWHDVDVKVIKQGRYQVRARRGYFVDGPARR